MGNAPQYLANTLFKLIAGSKLKEEDSYGIKGFEVKIEAIKSRTAPAGIMQTLIFSQTEGFDDLLSRFNFIKNAGRIGGNGRGFYLDTQPTIKFTLKTLKERYTTDETFAAAFDAVADEEFTKTLKISAKIKASQNSETKPVETTDTETDTTIN